MDRNQELGLRGEKAFSLACSSAGLICNKSLEDMGGWDFYVQFALDENYIGPLDHRPPSLCGFFQVKTSTRTAKHIEIKLSNAEMMVRESRPTFFAIGLENENKDISFSLGHIGGKAIAFVLEKLRQVKQEKIKFINRKIIYIPISLLDLENVVQPTDIGKVIRKYCLNDIEKYITEKIQFSKSVGYNFESFQGSFSIVGNDADNQMVALMLGEIEEIQVVNFIVTETRFDIKSTKTFVDSGIMKIYSSSNLRGIVIFKSNSNEISSEFSTVIRVPSIPNLNSELFRVRFENDLFAFSVSPAGDVTNWRLTPDWNAHKPWNEIRNNLVLIELLRMGECEIEAFFGSNRLIQGALKTEGFSSDGMSKNIDEFSLAVRTIDRLYQEVCIRVCLDFSMNEFFQFLEKCKAMIYMIGSFQNHDILIRSTLNHAPKEQYSYGKFIFPLIFRCGDLVNAIPVIAEGKVSFSDQEVEMIVSKTSHLTCGKFKTTEQSIFFLKKFVKEFCADCLDSDFVVVHDAICPSKDEHLLSM